MKRALSIFLIFLLGCAGTSTLEEPSPSSCGCFPETIMSKVLTEDSANADFTNGLTYPTAGESGSIWWDLVEGSIQQLADRSQALASFYGEHSINLVDGWVPGSSNQFDLILGGSPAEKFHWLNTDITGLGGVYFPVDVFVGLKIISVTARISGGTYLGTSHSSLPVTLPTVRLVRQSDGVQSLVGVQADTSANTASYDPVHSVTLAADHVVLTNNHYLIQVTGEASTNAVNDKTALVGLSVLVGQP